MDPENAPASPVEVGPLENPADRVGWGPTSWVGYLTAAASILFALSTGLLTLAGALPADLSPGVAAALVAAGGVMGALSLAVTAVARELRARSKVQAEAAFLNSTAAHALAHAERRKALATERAAELALEPPREPVKPERMPPIPAVTRDEMAAEVEREGPMVRQWRAEQGEMGRFVPLDPEPYRHLEGPEDELLAPEEHGWVTQFAVQVRDDLIRGVGRQQEFRRAERVAGPRRPLP